MKYIIDIPDDGQCQYRYNEDTKELKFSGPRLDPNSFMGLDITISISGATPYTEPDRKAIEDEVWELVGVIANMDNNDYGRVFGCIGRWTLLSKKTYQEVKEKYEAMEKNEICVGDEVDYFFMKGIVTRVDDDFGVNVLWKDGTCSNLTSNVVKTGKHFPEVANLLDKMRGEIG